MNLDTDSFPVLFNRDRIRRLVRRQGEQIDRYARTLGFRRFRVICIMDAAFVYCADLVRAMRTPVALSFVKATSYAGTRKSRITVRGFPDALPGPNGDECVLVVDTVYDTGQTVEAIIRRLRRRRCSVALAVLVEKPGKAPRPPAGVVQDSFVGAAIQGDPFIVGYGLDHSGHFRHLPDIREYRERPLHPRQSIRTAARRRA